MIGIPYNLFGQLNIKVLLICPYDLNNHGGVQNQVKLLKKGLINKGIDTKILGPSSLDYDIGPVSYTHIRAHETPEHRV